LADSDSEEEAEGGDASAWVEKSRKLEQQKKLAAQKARELEEAENAALEEEEEAEGGGASESSAKVPAKAKKASTKSTKYDPSGLKVTHDSSDFAEGETTILTLKDMRVLEDGDVNMGTAESNGYVEVRQVADLGVVFFFFV